MIPTAKAQRWDPAELVHVPELARGLEHLDHFRTGRPDDRGKLLRAGLRVGHRSQHRPGRAAAATVRWVCEHDGTHGWRIGHSQPAELCLPKSTSALVTSYFGP
jgi:hypothetical protein